MKRWQWFVTGSACLVGCASNPPPVELVSSTPSSPAPEVQRAPQSVPHRRRPKRPPLFLRNEDFVQRVDRELAEWRDKVDRLRTDATRTRLKSRTEYLEDAASAIEKDLWRIRALRRDLAAPVISPWSEDRLKIEDLLTDVHRRYQTTFAE